MAMNANGRYDIDVETDVLREFINQLVCKYGNYIDDNGINDRVEIDNPVVINYKAALALRNYSYKIRTYEEVDEADRKLDELWRYYNGLQ